jgi:UDP-3-O-[3-hydroxymyristoyl] glucosamine N-acyltransferase
MRNISVEEILPFLDREDKILGNKNYYFNNVKPSDSINEGSLDWVNALIKNKVEYIQKSKARIIICDNSVEINEDLTRDRCLIVVKNTKLTFLRIANKFFVKETKYEIHPSAIIHPEARIANNCFIGPLTYIGNSEINEGTIIQGRCHIYDNVVIGKNVKIKAGAVIGGDGFGYQKNSQGVFEKFPQIGSVIIKDNVDIGSNTCIDRGALGNTIIEEGTKIDNLVQISHNVKVGKHCAITANTVIAGSTIIGDYTWVSPSATIRDQIKIGKNVMVGMGATVTKNIPDDETWLGLPAMPFFDIVRILRKLTKST